MPLQIGSAKRDFSSQKTLGEEEVLASLEMTGMGVWRERLRNAQQSGARNPGLRLGRTGLKTRHYRAGERSVWEKPAPLKRSCSEADLARA